MDWDNDYYFNWKTGVDYVMLESGELKDPSAVDEPREGTYEYRRDTTLDRDTAVNGPRIEEERIERERQIDEQRRRIEEERRKLEELERRNREGTTKVPEENTPVKRGKADLLLKSPIFSMIVS